mmetsp:Transcript_13677/g.46061  ORF Transcript_13677/g.46061 Transcript_13677/m.46061 type:complete len:266 (-) Transcript_13677:55-852(-)
MQSTSSADWSRARGRASALAPRRPPHTPSRRASCCCGWRRTRRWWASCGSVGIGSGRSPRWTRSTIGSPRRWKTAASGCSATTPTTGCPSTCGSGRWTCAASRRTRPWWTRCCTSWRTTRSGRTTTSSGTSLPSSRPTTSATTRALRRTVHSSAARRRCSSPASPSRCLTCAPQSWAPSLATAWHRSLRRRRRCSTATSPSPSGAAGTLWAGRSGRATAARVRRTLAREPWRQNARRRAVFSSSSSSSTVSGIAAAVTTREEGRS